MFEYLKDKKIKHLFVHLPFLPEQTSTEPTMNLEVMLQVLKELTLHGYFTSEIGATKALNYDPIPGVWIPDLPIDENTKAWTPMF